GVGRGVQQPQQRLALAGQFGVGQAEPGGGALAGDQQQVGAPVETVVRGVAAVAGVAEQVRPPRGGRGGPAGHGGAVHQPQQLGGGRGVVGQPAQGGLQQVGGTAQTPVVFGLGQQPGEQVPD